MKSQKQWLGMAASLGLICIASAALMSWVYGLTSEPIAEARENSRRQAISEVAPSFDNNPLEEALEVTPEGASRPVTVYPLSLGGKDAGCVVESWSDEGFSGEIRIMFGFDADGRVSGYRVLEQSETPGLGSRMQPWFSDTSSPSRCVVGRAVADTDFRVSKDGGDIDGITAATISSRAFLDALRRAATNAKTAEK